jgi:hypothetical protein
MSRWCNHRNRTAPNGQRPGRGARSARLFTGDDALQTPCALPGRGGGLGFRCIHLLSIHDKLIANGRGVIILLSIENKLIAN